MYYFIYVGDINRSLNDLHVSPLLKAVKWKLVLSQTQIVC